MSLKEGVFGPVFTTYRGDLANPGGYGAVFWKVYLEKVQANTDLIDDKVDIGIYLFADYMLCKSSTS